MKIFNKNKTPRCARCKNELAPGDYRREHEVKGKTEIWCWWCTHL